MNAGVHKPNQHCNILHCNACVFSPQAQWRWPSSNQTQRRQTKTRGKKQYTSINITVTVSMKSFLLWTIYVLPLMTSCTGAAICFDILSQPISAFVIKEHCKYRRPLTTILFKFVPVFGNRKRHIREESHIYRSPRYNYWPQLEFQIQTLAHW